ncbi:hypothetical protein F5Y09DRAFT_324553 [Xylaria sp. FL1042]|nr:hypothetical protein F5Y09DRAFT_324553 [Xylaria sp. FL1042]
MPVPNYSVVPATEDDIPILGDFLQDSKLQLAINRFLILDWPNFPFQKAHYTNAIKGGLSNPRTTSLKVIDNTSGKLVAQLVYTKKVSPPGEGESSTTEGNGGEANNEVPVGIVPDVYWAVMDAVKELEPNLETDEYIELTHMYVEPSSRRRGIGSRLLQIVEEAAAAENLPLTLFAEPNHHDFFVGHGFRDVKDVDIDLRKWAAPLSGYGVFRVSRMIFEGRVDAKATKLDAT